MPSKDVAGSESFYRKVFGWNIRRRGDGSVAFDDAAGEVSGSWVLGRPPMRKVGLLVYVTYSVPSTERLLNAKHFSRLPPKSVARQEALWQDTLREGSVRALCQGREYNSSGLTCHLKEAVRARNSIERYGFRRQIVSGSTTPDERRF